MEKLSYFQGCLIGVAEISDDTQMTLFTAIGLLTQKTRMNLRGICGPAESYVYKYYQDWLKNKLKPIPYMRNIFTLGC